MLTAIAAGRSLTDETAAGAGLGDRLHVVQRALQILESLCLVDRERNFAASERTSWRSRIADNAARFWHRFVLPNRSRLERPGAWSGGRCIGGSVAPYLDTLFAERLVTCKLLEPWLDNRSPPVQCTRCPQIFAKRSSLTQLSRTCGRALRR